MNNRGIVLLATRWLGIGRVVFTGDGDSLTPIATADLVTPSGERGTNVFGTAINDQGTVVVLTQTKRQRYCSTVACLVDCQL